MLTILFKLTLFILVLVCIYIWPCLIGYTISVLLMLIVLSPVLILAAIIVWLICKILHIK